MPAALHRDDSSLHRAIRICARENLATRGEVSVEALLGQIEHRFPHLSNGETEARVVREMQRLEVFAARDDDADGAGVCECASR